MTRWFARLAALFFILSLWTVPLGAQEAPEGVWLGTWPYTPLPDHHLNAFATNGLNTNLGSIYREFVELAPAFYVWAENIYRPLLASSWGFVNDNTVYELRLRDDALWSNGSQVNADDVITTYALGRLVGWSQFNFIDEVTKVDDFMVHFRFKGEPSLQAERLILHEPIISRDTYGEWSARALELFATGATNGSAEWQALLTEFRAFRPETIIASGPYNYSLEDVGIDFMMLHWQPNSIYSDTVRFGSIKLWAGETDVTAPLVLSGEIAHSTNIFSPLDIEEFQSAGIDIVTIPRGYGPALLFNVAREPWNIKEVRQAVALVIDRDQSAFLTNGFGAVATEYMSGILDANAVNMLSEDVLEGLDHYDYDPIHAADLLESVGFSRNADDLWADSSGNVIQAEYIYPQEFGDFSRAALDAVEQLNDFGFDITARAMTRLEVPEAMTAGNFDLSVWSWGAQSPLAGQHFRNPVQRWGSAFLGADNPGLGIPTEVTFDSSTYNLDELINSVNSGLDTSVHQERADIVAQILNEEMFYVPLHIILSAEPFNAAYIEGMPAPDDPLLQNPSGTDHFMKWYLLNGQLSPTEAAMQ
jgi:peptide/nickel transport system substrate-binding protein